MPFQYRHIPIEKNEDFAIRASAELEQAILETLEEKDSCVLGLSGGSTPRAIYEELGSLVAVPWEQVTIFLVDERYVPADDKKSNQHLISETLLAGEAGSRITESQIVFPDTSLELAECVEDYDFRIGQLSDRGIDVLALGMGADGHIASLFPGQVDALIEEAAFAIHTTTDSFDVHDRITVTIPVLLQATHPFFFLQGKEKKKIFTEVLAANADAIEYPAHALLAEGRTTWVTMW